MLGLPDAHIILVGTWQPCQQQQVPKGVGHVHLGATYGVIWGISQSWSIVKITINSNINSSERPLSNSNTNSNSLVVSLAIAIPIAIVPKMVNSNSKSIAIVQFLLLKRALKEIFISEMHLHSIWNAFGTKKCILRLEKQHFRPAL